MAVIDTPSLDYEFSSLLYSYFKYKLVIAFVDVDWEFELLQKFTLLKQWTSMLNYTKKFWLIKQKMGR